MSEPAPPAREEFVVLLARAFPDLTEAERAEVLRASGYVARWVARLSRDLGYGEEPAHVFVARERGP